MPDLIQNRIRKVMIVDDEADIRRVGEMSLQLVGKLQVVLADGGEQALKLALEEMPDVILLDVMMPRLDGPSTLARLRATPKIAGIPVIFMTARVQRHQVASYLASGAQGVIFKPFDPMTLPQEIGRITGST